MIKDIGLNRNARILDIGTGFGAMSILLAMNGYNVLTGQPEHDPESEEHESHHGEDHKGHEHHHGFPTLDWQENAQALGVNDRIEFMHLNAESLDFPDNSFDGIFMYDTLQHTRNRGIALNESVGIVKPSGLICVIEWNQRTIQETEEKEGFTIDYIDPGEFLNSEDISIELKAGFWVNVFIVRKIH